MKAQKSKSKPKPKRYLVNVPYIFSKVKKRKHYRLIISDINKYLNGKIEFCKPPHEHKPE